MVWRGVLWLWTVRRGAEDWVGTEVAVWCWEEVRELQACTKPSPCRKQCRAVATLEGSSQSNRPLVCGI